MERTPEEITYLESLHPKMNKFSDQQRERDLIAFLVSCGASTEEIMSIRSSDNPQQSAEQYYLVKVKIPQEAARRVLSSDPAVNPGPNYTDEMSDHE